MKTCAADGCLKPVCARELCVNHYRRGRKDGTLPKLERKPPKVCKAPECDRPMLAHGWCSAHYARWRKTGDARTGEPLEVVPGFAKCARCQRVKNDADFTAGATWCKRCVLTHASNRRKGRTCSTCAEPITDGSKSGLCVTCNGISRRATTPRRSINATGPPKREPQGLTDTQDLPDQRSTHDAQAHGSHDATANLCRLSRANT